MRTAAGVTLAAQGIISLSACSHLTTALLVAEIVVTATGAFVLIGFLTPVFSSLALLQCLGIMLFGVCLPSSLFSSKFAPGLAITIFVAIALLGPGCYSLDARLFGWKEIVIPASPHKPER